MSRHLPAYKTAPLVEGCAKLLNRAEKIGNHTELYRMVLSNDTVIHINASRSTRAYVPEAHGIEPYPLNAGEIVVWFGEKWQYWVSAGGGESASPPTDAESDDQLFDVVVRMVWKLATRANAESEAN